jgi:hypothetical protein
MMQTRAAALAPSEVVLLHADEFAPPAGALDAKMDYLHEEGKAQAKGLGRALFTAAFLGMEQAGALRLESRPKKTLFGLRTVPALFAERAGAPAAWPEGSLEARIVQTLQGGAGEVGAIVYRLLGDDSTAHYNLAPDLAQAGLGGRGVLEVEKTQHMKILSAQRFRLPDAARGLLVEFPTGGVRQALDATEQGRPELWKALRDAIDSGVARRRQAND